MPRGGSRPGNPNGKRGGFRANAGRKRNTGRKPGMALQRSREVANALSSEGQTPLEYMVEVFRSSCPPEILEMVERMKAENRLEPDAITRLKTWHEMRFEAAKNAAPYMHPRLQTTTVKGDPNDPLKVEIVKFADNPNP